MKPLSFQIREIHNRHIFNNNTWFFSNFVCSPLIILAQCLTVQSCQSLKIVIFYTQRKLKWLLVITACNTDPRKKCIVQNMLIATKMKIITYWTTLASCFGDRNSIHRRVVETWNILTGWAVTCALLNEEMCVFWVFVVLYIRWRDFFQLSKLAKAKCIPIHKRSVCFAQSTPSPIGNFMN